MPPPGPCTPLLTGPPGRLRLSRTNPSQADLRRPHPPLGRSHLGLPGGHDRPEDRATADNLDGPLAEQNRSGYTSPTNIGGYLWSAVVVRDLGLISRGECSRRIAQTLGTLSRLDHHRPSGMYYNWYDEADGDVLTTWPDSGDTVVPFLSSVDNGWLAAAFMLVEKADPANRTLAKQLGDRMNFAAYYNPEAGVGKAGLLRGGFWDSDPKREAVVGNYLGNGPDVWYTPNHYDTTVSETRIASFIAIARGQVPRSTTSAPGAPSRRPRTGPGTNISRPVGSGPTSASRCTRAPTPTSA